MVDDAPGPDDVLPAARRPASPARAGGPQRRLRPPCAPNRRSSGPKSAGPTRRCSAPSMVPPLRPPRAAAQARAAGRRRSGWRSRSTSRAARRPHVRADLLRALSQAVRERRVARRTRSGCSDPAAPGRRRARREDPRGSGPTCKLPDDPGVYVFRNEAGQPLYVGKSVAVKSRARAQFCQPGDWTGQAEVVDYIPTNSELGALILENRLIKRGAAGQPALKRTDRWVYLVCRLDIPFPVLEVARSRPRPGGQHRPGEGARTPARSSPTSSPHCSGSATAGARWSREHPSLYGQMGRCVSPCLGDLDPNAYPAASWTRARRFRRGTGPGRAPARPVGAVERASAEQRFERAAVMARPAGAACPLLERLGGLVRAVARRDRGGARADIPVKDGWDLFWVVGGPGSPIWGACRTRGGACRARIPRGGAVPVVAPDEARGPDRVARLAGDEAGCTSSRWARTSRAWVEPVTGERLGADDEVAESEGQSRRRGAARSIRHPFVRVRSGAGVDNRVSAGAGWCRRVRGRLR